MGRGKAEGFDALMGGHRGRRGAVCRSDARAISVIEKARTSLHAGDPEPARTLVSALAPSGPGPSAAGRSLIDELAVHHMSAAVRSEAHERDVLASHKAFSLLLGQRKGAGLSFDLGGVEALAQDDLAQRIVDFQGVGLEGLVADALRLALCEAVAAGIRERGIVDLSKMLLTEASSWSSAVVSHATNSVDRAYIDRKRVEAVNAWVVEQVLSAVDGLRSESGLEGEAIFAAPIVRSHLRKVLSLAGLARLTGEAYKPPALPSLRALMPEG